jgi:hypothetical protein
MTQQTEEPIVKRRVNRHIAAVAGAALAVVVLVLGLAPAPRVSASGPYIPINASGSSVGTTDQYYGYGGYGLGYGLGYGGYGLGYGGYGLGYGLGYGGYGLGGYTYSGGFVYPVVTLPPPSRTYSLGGQYCTDAHGGQIWVPTGATPSSNLTCGTQSAPSR